MDFQFPVVLAAATMEALTQGKNVNKIPSYKTEAFWETKLYINIWIYQKRENPFLSTI